MNKRYFDVFRTRGDGVAALLFLAPSLAGFSVFYAVPFAMGLYESFVDPTGGGRFVGFAHYREVLDSGSFRRAAINTLLFAGLSVPLLTAASLLIALLLDSRPAIRRWLQTAFVLPLVVPVASVVAVWQIVFDWNGALNAWLSKLGMARVDWLNSGWARGVTASIYLWKNIGYNMILFLAGLQTIPRSYYESASLDGAGMRGKLRHITLVYLTPTMFFVVLISIINAFKAFRETYMLAGEYPYDAIYMLQHYMNNMFASLDVPKLAAAAALMVGAIALLVSGFLAAERRFRDMLD